jgi:putative Ig domain-containing protein
MKVALVLTSLLAAIAVSGAAAADFEGDNGPCRETPGEQQLLRCPTAYVGQEYEVEIELEEGSGCVPYVYFEIVNSSLPAGLSIGRTDGVISGIPAGGPGLTRFWIHNHDLTQAQGGPSWCQRDDVSEREFSIPVDPGLAITTDEVEPAAIGQPYSQTLTAKRIMTIDPLTGTDVQAEWSLVGGNLPAGVTLSTSGVISGTPTVEGSFQFVVKAVHEAPFATEAFHMTVRQPLVVTSPFGSSAGPNAEVGVRLAKTVTATGGSGSYSWSLSSGALPAGVVLDPATGTLSGTPRVAGNFALGLTATDSEGRAQTLNAVLRVARRLAIRPLRSRTAIVGRSYRATLSTVGGVGRARWRVVGGKLPAGVRLSRLGALAGRPTRAGKYRVVIEARDVLGVRSRAKLLLTVTG